ncbi:hypothetical protein D3C78_1555560 [compost metagenome]
MQVGLVLLRQLAELLLRQLLLVLEVRFTQTIVWLGLRCRSVTTRQLAGILFTIMKKMASMINSHPDLKESIKLIGQVIIGILRKA